MWIRSLSNLVIFLWIRIQLAISAWTGSRKPRSFNTTLHSRAGVKIKQTKQINKQKQNKKQTNTKQRLGLVHARGNHIHSGKDKVSHFHLCQKCRISHSADFISKNVLSSISITLTIKLICMIRIFGQSYVCNFEFCFYFIFLIKNVLLVPSYVCSSDEITCSTIYMYWPLFACVTN